MNLIKSFKGKFGSNRQTLTFKRNFETYQNIAQHFQEAKVDFKTLKNIFFPGMKRNFIEDIFSVILVNIGKKSAMQWSTKFHARAGNSVSSLLQPAIVRINV